MLSQRIMQQLNEKFKLQFREMKFVPASQSNSGEDEVHVEWRDGRFQKVKFTELEKLQPTEAAKVESDEDVQVRRSPYIGGSRW
jgi:hypothetical protein